MTTPDTSPIPEALSSEWAYTHHIWGVHFPTVPFASVFIDIATVVLILWFLFFSFLSITFILIIHLKSRHSHHLRNFSSHSTARFLMILLISLWSINEFLRLPMFRRWVKFPHMPSENPVQYHTHFCKLHLILSFGLYEPGFLISLLFLVNISVKRRGTNDLWALGFVVIACLPIMVALYVTVYILPSKITMLPLLFFRTSVVLDVKKSWTKVVLCTYPLLGNVIFTMFGVAYALAFSLSCFRVVEVAINKRLQARVNILVYTIIICLTVQIVMLTASLLWKPESVKFHLVALVNFLCVFSCGVVGETILVIMPIIDALRVGAADKRWYCVV